MNIRNKIIAGTLFLYMITSCDSVYTSIDNAAYFGEAQKENIKNVVVGDEGAETSLFVSLASPAEKDVAVSVGIDEAYIERYNSKNGTNYHLLPASYYELASRDVTVLSGDVVSEMLDIKIKPFDEGLNTADKYAIPVRIVSAKGVGILESSSEMLLVCDKIINTKVYFTKGGTGKGGEVGTYEVKAEDSAFKNINIWTLEFMSYCESYLLNAHNLSIKGTDGKVAIFSRFGEYSHPENEIQFGIKQVYYYGSFLYEPKRWYHVAMTCDGTTLKLYQNGKLDIQVANPDPGKPFDLASFTIKQGNPGAMSEFRFWNVVRSQTELQQNMYAVNPSSEGLLIYWKMDDGEGSTVFKDATGNGRDMTITAKSGTWKDQKFPPEEE